MPGLMMPAFSEAMAARELPSHCWWSMPMGVMRETTGVRALVASRRPPIPVSRTMDSAPERSNQSSASMRESSKNVGCGSHEETTGRRASMLRLRSSGGMS